MDGDISDDSQESVRGGSVVKFFLFAKIRFESYIIRI